MGRWFGGAESAENDVENSTGGENDTLIVAVVWKRRIGESWDLLLVRSGNVRVVVRTT